MLAKILVGCLIAVLNLAAGGALFAQTIPTTQQSPFCFHPAQISKCSQFLIFELRGEASLNNTKRTFTYGDGDYPVSENLEDLPSYASFELGGMTNHSASTAIGATVEVGFRQGSPFRIAAKARRRTWLANGLAADVAAGPIGVQLQHCFDCANAPKAFGGTGDIVLTYRDEIGVLVGADVIRGAGRTSTGIRAGGELESHTAVVASLASALAIGILATAYLGGSLRY